MMNLNLFYTLFHKYKILMLVVILFSCSDDGMPEPNEPPTVMTPETSEPTQTEKYTISTSAGTGGTITGNQTIESGQSVSITATAQEHYQLKEWTGDCGTFDKNNLKISFTASKNCQVSAVFEKIPYTITATSTSGGSIGEQTELNKVQGDTVTFTAIPEENFNLVYEAMKIRIVQRYRNQQIQK